MTSGVMMMVGSFVGVSCPQEYVMFLNLLLFFLLLLLLLLLYIFFFFFLEGGCLSVVLLGFFKMILLSYFKREECHNPVGTSWNSFGCIIY